MELKRSRKKKLLMGMLITGCSILFIALMLCFLHISLRTNYTQRTAKLEAQLVMESPEAPPIETIEVIRPWYSYWGEDWTYVVYFLDQPGQGHYYKYQKQDRQYIEVSDRNT